MKPLPDDDELSWTIGRYSVPPPGPPSTIDRGGFPPHTELVLGILGFIAILVVLWAAFS